MEILSAKKFYDQEKKTLKDRVKKWSPRHCVQIFGFSNDTPSRIYRNALMRDCADIGIDVKCTIFDDDVCYDEVRESLKDANEDTHIQSIMIQKPFPKTLKEYEKYIENILWHSDKVVDINRETPWMSVHSATPEGIMQLLKFYDIDIEGKDCVIINRTDVVGRPLAKMFLDNNGTVTVCHSKTKNLLDHLHHADIIVTAVGIPNFITSDMVKNGAIIVDVGINTVDGKVCGDVDINSMQSKNVYVTPVPDGVGLSTRIALLSQIVAQQ